jgi:hypothetical protein
MRWRHRRASEAPRAPARTGDRLTRGQYVPAVANSADVRGYGKVLDEIAEAYDR